MKHFAALYQALDESPSTRRKQDALLRWLGEASDRDAAWAIYFLAGGRPQRAIGTRVLRQAALELSGLPEWLFEECYQAVGDLAETIALVIPSASPKDPAPASFQEPVVREPEAQLPLASLAPSAQGAARTLRDESLADWMQHRILPLRGQSDWQALQALRSWWPELQPIERFLLVKLIGGGFRVGVAKQLVIRTLAEHAQIDATRMAQRMMGYTDRKQIPKAEDYQRLIDPELQLRESGQPYPFFLAHPVSQAPEEQLGELANWQVEGKYDGIRAQVVRRADSVWIWSRGEELISDSFPEVCAAALHWPTGTVIDGELLVWDSGAAQPASFARLQTRLGRSQPSPKLQREQPVRLLAYDLLEWQHTDWRSRPLRERRTQLESLAQQGLLQVAPVIHARSWQELAAIRAQAREQVHEGLMLKDLEGAYGVGRTRQVGQWWKWKLDPLTVDAVLIYAQAGHGRRAGLYTDFTFAVWTRPPLDAEEARLAIARRTDTDLQLVPIAKAYSGLTDAEFKSLDAILRKTTREKFGPVRSVEPTQVFEIGFEGIARSPRHKSGVALRFPRMLRWRTDKPLHEANSLPDLESLLMEPRA